MIKREKNWRSFFPNKLVEEGNSMHLQYILHRICKNLWLKKERWVFFLSLTNAQSLVQTCGGPVGILSPSLCQCLLFLWIPSETRALLHYKMRHSLYTMPLRNGTVDPNVLNPVFLVYSSAFSTFRSRYLIVWICEIVLYTKSPFKTFCT